MGDSPGRREGRGVEKQQGYIALDSEKAIAFGFTSDKFHGYLWELDGSIYISLIISLKPRQGHLSALFDAIWRAGYAVKVPTPSARMVAILTQKGFSQTWELCGDMEDVVEVWVKSPIMEATECS